MKEKTSVKLTFSLLQLQNLIKRDPPSYYEEFQQQYEHFKAQLQLFKFNPQVFNENLADLVSFLAQVSSCYPEDLKDFPEELMNILRNYATVLQPNMRHCLVKALILMRNRGILSPTDLTTLLFELLRCQDKLLRDMVQVHIVTDLKKINAHHKNQKVNTVLQNFMFKMLADDDKTAPRVSLDIMIDLYRRNIWRDEKTVNAIATACFSKDVKLLAKAIHFFLNIDHKDEDEDEKSSSEDDAPTLREVVQSHKVNKKTRKRKKILEKAKQHLKKSKKRKKNHETINFAAIHLLHDPLGLAEKLFARLQKMREGFEIKLLVMNFISRLIGIHELLVLNFYPFLRKFIKPRQTDVTKILMCAAQAVHEYVPPDAVQEIVKEILNNFVTERNSSEVITVGINSIREICARCPLAIDRDLLHDLAQYEKYKDKNVTMAAKSLIKLFREINPKMLQRKFRSRPTEASKQIDSTKFEYGALSAKSYVPGTENLSLDPSAEVFDIKAEDEANDSDGSWIDLSHSEDEMPVEEDDESEEEADESEEEADESEEEEDESEEDDDVEIKEEDNIEIKKEDNIEIKKEDDVEIKKGGENNDEDIKPGTVELTENGANKSKTDDLDKNKTGKKVKTKASKNVEDEKIKAETISHSRILSQEEFQKIKAIQIANKVQYAKGKKRKAESMTKEPELKKTEVVSLSDIERLHKKPKVDKETRLTTVMEGREGREKFGKKKEKNPHASKTKKQQKKNKAFMMIKHKVRSKVKRSFRDKQLALRNALLKRRKKH